ncbi:hypothetical protein HDU67_003580 [Dinochytrium kinnereticum]|nr:hypothetical protein HDU67_003580 [Dinochytrium kinnereticum]
MKRHFDEVITIDDEEEESSHKKNKEVLLMKIACLITTLLKPSKKETFLDPRIRLIKIHPTDDPLQNIACTSLSELLEGDIDQCYQFNYMLDLNFFMAHVPSNNICALFHFVVHKDPHVMQQAKELGMSTIKFTFPYVEQYGSSAPKLYTSSDFEHDLLNYLKSYGRDLEPLVERLREYDFSTIMASIVASVPGRHKASDSKMKMWGHTRFGSLLGDVELSEGCRKESTIVLQAVLKSRVSRKG